MDLIPLTAVRGTSSDASQAQGSSIGADAARRVNWAIGQLLDAELVDLTGQTAMVRIAGVPVTLSVPEGASLEPQFTVQVMNLNPLQLRMVTGGGTSDSVSLQLHLAGASAEELDRPLPLATASTTSPIDWSSLPENPPHPILVATFEEAIRRVVSSAVQSIASEAAKAGAPFERAEPELAGFTPVRRVDDDDFDPTRSIVDAPVEAHTGFHDMVASSSLTPSVRDIVTASPLVWGGPLWAGQELEISIDAPGARNQRDSFLKGRSVNLRLRLPESGEVAAELNWNTSGLRIAIEAQRQETVDALRAGASTLLDNLSSLKLRVAGLAIRHV